MIAVLEANNSKLDAVRTHRELYADSAYCHGQLGNEALAFGCFDLRGQQADRQCGPKSAQ
jgi:hypothetical protein